MTAPRVVDLPRRWDLTQPSADVCAAELRRALTAERESRARVPPTWVLVLYALAIWVATWTGCRVWLASDAAVTAVPICPDPEQQP